jgi:hypothetical protein
MEPITEQQAASYEVYNLSFLASEFYKIFPKIFSRKIIRKYKRYLGSIQYSKVYEERQKNMRESLSSLYDSKNKQQ